MVSSPTRSGNHHIRSPVQVLALLDGCPTPRHHHIPQPHRLENAPEGVPDLVSQLPGMCQGLTDRVCSIGTAKAKVLSFPGLATPTQLDRRDTGSLHRCGEEIPRPENWSCNQEQMQREEKLGESWVLGQVLALECQQQVLIHHHR